MSDTTADRSEPQRNVRLGIPRVIVDKRRRRKRQTPGRGANGLTSSQRIYQIDYKYVSQKTACNLKTAGTDCVHAVLRVNVF